jgi:hypothetical protein
MPMSKSEFGDKNSKDLLRLAQHGITPERAAIAWKSATERLGQPVRRVAIVQDELVRLAVKPSGTSGAGIEIPNTGDPNKDLDIVIARLQGQE